MAKRKTDNSYQCDSKRFSVPLPDFSVPPPGFNSAPFTSQNFQSNWFSGPAQQQQQASYGFYNYNAAETSNFANASAFFWTPNKPRNFQNAQQTRPSVIPNLKLRGRGRGRAPGRGNDSYINKSPRSSNSSGGAPQWFPNSMNNSNSRFSNTYSNDNDRISESGSINVSDEKNESKKTIVNKKGKRKSMSQKYSSKPWDLESAEKAVAVELEYNRLQNTQSLILKFPDAELNKEIVKNFNSNIEHVHFQQPSTPRYCFVQLCEGADVDSVQNQLREVTFGGGKITVEKKINQKSKELAPEKIDPYTLYVGNLPTNITAETVKAIYPTAFRVDIGYAQKMKYTRYAFISYQSAEAAIKAFKDTHSLSLESRSIIVRFRRHKGAVGLPGQSKTPGHLSEEAVSKSAGNTKQQSKKSSLSMTDDGDIGGSDLHDGPMEIDEDDYDIPYHDDLDEHYNSDFDDSLFDNLRSSSKECKRSNKDEISTSRNSSTYRESLSKTNKSQQLRENTSSMSASDILKSKENEEISANDAAKKNVEQQIEELIPNVITQLLKSSEIKQEPLEKDNMEQLLQNQFPDFANHITALAVDAIKKEPLFAEYLLRKKQVPMPMLCADEIKTEPAELNEDGDGENDVTLANIVPKIEAPESDDQDDGDLNSLKTSKRTREAMYKRPQKFKRYKPGFDNAPANFALPEQPVEDFDMSYLLDYISEEQAQFEELNRETMEAARYISANLHNMNETNVFPSSTGTNDNCNNSSSDVTTSRPDFSDTFSSKSLTSSTFESCSPVPIRLPMSRPANTETNMSKNLSSDSSNFVSSSIGISSDSRNQFNTGTPPPTRTPPMLGMAESVSVNAKPTATILPVVTVSPLVTDIQTSSSNVSSSGKYTTSSSQLSTISSSTSRPSSQTGRQTISITSQFLSPPTSHCTTVNSPVTAVAPLTFSSSDQKSSNLSSLSTKSASGISPKSADSLLQSKEACTSSFDHVNKSTSSTPKISRKSYIGSLDRDPSIQLTPSNAKNIKITNIIRPGSKAKTGSKPLVRSTPVLTKQRNFLKTSSDFQEKQSNLNLSFDEFSEDEEDNTDYVALLGAPPANLDDFINKT